MTFPDLLFGEGRRTVGRLERQLDREVSVVLRFRIRGSNVAAILGVLVVVSLLPTVALRSSALASEAAALELIPHSAPAGATVTAVATGFGLCPPVGSDDASPGAVVFAWDGKDELSRAGVKGNSATATFIVPDPGDLQTHRVTARCVGGGGDPTASAAFTVTALELDPGKGPPGATVSAVATGFGGCPPVGSDDASPGAVVFAWDGKDELSRVGVKGGSATTTFLVPESSALGEHQVTARCVGEGDPAAFASFSVTAPQVVNVLVPNILGMTGAQAADILRAESLLLGETSGAGDEVQSQEPKAGTAVPPQTRVNITLGTKPDLVVVPNIIERLVNDAKGELKSSGLRLGSISGQGDVVQNQSPNAGVEVPRGSAVDVTLRTSNQALVNVPDLVGRDVALVPGILAASGLVLGLSAGQGDVVRGQDPLRGTQVKPGSSVNISVESRVKPPELVLVPSLVGGSAEEARSAVGRSGLSWGNAQESEEVVESQQPEAGLLVPLGTVVTVSYRQPNPWWPTFVGLAVLLGSLLLAHHLVQRRRHRQWVRRHVHVMLQTPRDPVVTEPLDGAPPATVVRIEPRPDGGTHVLEEL